MRRNSKVIRFKRYQDNLYFTPSKVYSFNRVVAIIDHESRTLKKVGSYYWCSCNLKHVQYAAGELGYSVFD